MDIRDDGLARDYFMENCEKTLHTGKLTAYLGIPILLYFVFQDFFILNVRSFFIWRMIAILPITLFLILNFLYFRKKTEKTILFHSISMACVMIMAVGINITAYSTPGISEEIKFRVINAWIVSVFGIFMLSGGARKNVGFTVSVPIIFLIAYFLVYQKISAHDWTDFINPLVVSTLVVFISIIQERLYFNEFKTRKTLAKTLKKLENEMDNKKELEQKLTYFSYHDELTGLPNRRFMNDRLKKLAASSKRGYTSSLLSIDLDDFKIINDTKGHETGDQVLKTISGIFLKCVRTEDHIFRIGGDEFIIILEGIDQNKAGTVIERLFKKITGHRFVFDGREFKIGLSIGLVEINGSLDMDSILSRADIAMYQAKKEGKNKVVIARETV